jgi:hypothetical protein
MILGITLFTWVHTILSLAALVSGIVVLNAMFQSRSPEQWTLGFFISAVATAATSFGFPVAQFDAAHWMALVSLLALAAAIVARYGHNFAGAWRQVYVVGTTLSVYLIVAGLIAHAFTRIGALRAIAPTLTEWPFVAVELIVLAVFVWAGYEGLKLFHLGGDHHGAHA